MVKGFKIRQSIKIRSLSTDLIDLLNLPHTLPFLPNTDLSRPEIGSDPSQAFLPENIHRYNLGLVDEIAIPEIRSDRCSQAKLCSAIAKPNGSQNS